MDSPSGKPKPSGTSKGKSSNAPKKSGPKWSEGLTPYEVQLIKLEKKKIANEHKTNLQKLQTEHLLAIGSVVAPVAEKLILSGALIWAWKEVGADKKLRPGDVLLGLIGGFTLGDALRGGLLANIYAAGYLSTLGLTAVPEGFVDAGGQIPFLAIKYGTPAGWVWTGGEFIFEHLKDPDAIKDSANTLAKLICESGGGTWDEEKGKCIFPPVEPPTGGEG